MQTFRLYTLVDITRTQVLKDVSDALKKKQQDNFNTLHQTLEMRGNVYFDENPKVTLHEWNKNLERTWIWNFFTEQDDIFMFDNDVVYHIKHDINYVPFNNNCTETVRFKSPIFLYGKNIKVDNIK
jgi:hypothetical protein